MTELGLLYVTLAAVAFAGLDAVRKRLSASVDPLTLTAWLQAVSLPLLGGWAAVVGISVEPAWIGPGAAAVAVMAASTLLFLHALRLAPLGRVVPFLSLGPVYSAVAGVILLGEWPRPVALAGIAVVSAGAFALARARTGGALSFERGSLYAAVVAGLWALAVAIDKLALAHANPPTHALLVTSSVLLLFVTERMVRAGPKALLLPRDALLPLGMAALLGTAAFAFQLSALAHALISVLEAVKRGLGAVLALVFGRLFFDEKVEPRAVLAVIAMAIGTALALLA